MHHTPSRRTTSRALAALIAVLAAPLALATIYKWSDADGAIHYTDRPPPAGAKLIAVEDASVQRERAPRPIPVAPVAGGTTGTAGSPAPTTGNEAKLKQAVAQDVAKASEQACKDAQQRYSNYIASRRLYREGPNKERVYLSETELETERLNARREVDDVCGH